MADKSPRKNFAATLYHTGHPKALLVVGSSTLCYPACMSIPLELLRGTPYFAGLPEAELRDIQKLVDERAFERGEMVLLEGEPSEAIYFVKSGRVKVFKTSPEGKEQVLRIMKPGESFNEVPVFDGGPNPASAETLDPSVLFLLYADDMQRLIVNNPTISRNVIHVLASRLRHLVGLVEDLSFRHVTGRVAKILLEHAHEASTSEGFRQLTQQQMATMAGTAREMVGRALKELEQAGAIRMERGKIVIVSREKLEQLS